MNLPKSETFFEERDLYYKGEGVPLIGSGNETGGGSPPAQPCLEVTLHEPSENPMTSVVGVRQNAFITEHPEWNGAPEQHTTATTWFIRHSIDNHGADFDFHEEPNCIVNEAERFAAFAEKMMTNHC